MVLTPIVFPAAVGFPLGESFHLSRNLRLSCREPRDCFIGSRTVEDSGCFRKNEIRLTDQTLLNCANDVVANDRPVGPAQRTHCGERRPWSPMRKVDRRRCRKVTSLGPGSCRRSSVPFRRSLSRRLSIATSLPVSPTASESPSPEVPKTLKRWTSGEVHYSAHYQPFSSATRPRIPIPYFPFRVPALSMNFFTSGRAGSPIQSSTLCSMTVFDAADSF